LAKYDNINLSKLFNDTLRNYFSITNIEEINKKISNLEQELAFLKKQRDEILQKPQLGDIKDKVLDDLKIKYKHRRDLGIPPDYDKEWLNSPTNKTKIDLLEEDVDSILHKLRDWYNSVN